MIGKLVEHPWDTIKVRLQTQSLLLQQQQQPSVQSQPQWTVGGQSRATSAPSSSSLPPKLFTGPWDCFRKTLQVEGVRGLYQVE